MRIDDSFVRFLATEVQEELEDYFVSRDMDLYGMVKELNLGDLSNLDEFDRKLFDFYRFLREERYKRNNYILGYIWGVLTVLSEIKYSRRANQ